MNRFQYHYFIIWSNGYDHIDQILDLLRKDEAIEILTIRRHQVRNMRKFVFDLYACDYVPVEHLYAKLKYLFKLKPEVINIFVKNYQPAEIIRGDPPFRKKQCLKMVKVKNTVRNRFNPRQADPNFRLAPLDRGVSHEHVIHASDTEAQTDYYLKLLGYEDGIGYLNEDSEGLPFKKPFHLKRPERYVIKNIPVSSLFANILQRHNGKVGTMLVPIVETPHYRAASGEMAVYQKYLNDYRFQYLNDDYHIEKFNQLLQFSSEELEKLPLVFAVPVEQGFQILDGVHRAAAYTRHGYKKIKCIVITNE